MGGPVRAAGLIIYRRLPPAQPNEYLLLQTSYGQHHWTPPKGHVDPGEDEWQSAVRETKEESGLDVEKDLQVVKNFRIVSEYTCTTKSRGTHDKRVTYWLAQLVRKEAKVVLSEEHRDFRWLPLEEACKLAKFESMQDALKKCEEKLTAETASPSSSLAAAPPVVEEAKKEAQSPTNNKMKMDAERHRFPFCVVWTPLPLITWLLPFIGHMGICTSEGVIRDFAGPYFVSEDDMAFGWPTRYMIMDPGKAQGGASGWDAAVAKASEIYGGRMHNLFCDNCHSHVARALNIMKYDGSSRWNMIWLCFRMLFCGKFVSFVGFLKTWLPFLVIATILTVIILSSSNVF